MDPLAPEQLHQKLFALTSQRLAHEKGWGRESLMRIAAAVDIACWDIIGKMAGLPLYQLFGGYRDRVPCYVTCAYYRDGKDLIELRDEMQGLKAQGHTGFKAKAGGLTLAEDMKRLEIVRDVIGGDKDLMVDVNRAWDLTTATEAVGLLEPLKPRWLEEPVRWADDRRELKLLSQRTRIPLSGGESEITGYGCRALLEEQAIQILQFDCTMFGGFTEGRKLVALCELNHVQVAPHHDCFIHAPLVASTPAGCILESFTDPERDPLQAELFENPPKIANGWVTLNNAPGLGLTLSGAALKKYGERIL
jgi:L-alanine-DL-glutamate epimerase-like enolase superfamily enzyme